MMVSILWHSNHVHIGSRMREECVSFLPPLEGTSKNSVLNNYTRTRPTLADMEDYDDNVYSNSSCYRFIRSRLRSA
ncbi:hypothetical protein HNY73_022980 [Argiope bruennichi]|uniref:Uncharacterized protein n=1 Tax=Argiope bruennichi TaxID=94029 RepID=A0A8T0E415_ARGBR|nr:hypothetical protein HNY73_022980 [Argiope bruennichi]